MLTLLVLLYDKAFPSIPPLSSLAVAELMKLVIVIDHCFGAADLQRDAERKMERGSEGVREREIWRRNERERGFSFNESKFFIK